jgi:hypothetical protein
MTTSRLRSRLAGLEKAYPRPCPACAGRPDATGIVYRWEGALQNRDGQPLEESDLLPCPACGKGGAEKILVGVNPDWLGEPGIRVVSGVDPRAVS